VKQRSGEIDATAVLVLLFARDLIQVVATGVDAILKSVRERDDLHGRMRIEAVLRGARPATAAADDADFQDVAAFGERAERHGMGRRRGGGAAPPTRAGRYDGSIRNGSWESSSRGAAIMRPWSRPVYPFDAVHRTSSAYETGGRGPVVPMHVSRRVRRPSGP
jgi:hypothetical protein